MRQQTAIIYFTRSIEAELSQKNFCEINASLNKKIVHELYNTTLKKIRQTGLPYFIIDENKQKGGYFGEKLANAFEEVYQLGFDNVIGNDSPGLSAKIILTANAALKNKKSVLGPSKDGGAYLIGIAKENFNKEKFIQVNWQTAVTYSQLYQLLQIASAKIYECIFLTDVDNNLDLVKVQNPEKWLQLIIDHIRRLTLQAIIPDNSFGALTKAIKILVLRGPPTIAV